MKIRITRAVGACAALGLALSLTACAESGSGSGGGGEGVDYGADAAEWKAAFADVDPISIITQTPAPQGSAVGSVYEKYFERVEEYSDGKITFEVSYANAVAGALEVDDAVLDGRLDAANILPVYEPDSYPENAVLANTSFLGSQAPAVNPVMLHGAMNEVAFEQSQVIEELEEAGFQVLLPWYSGDSAGILCPDESGTSESLKGKQIVASGVVNAAEIKGIGATPVSLDYTELFEALQRGTVDCSLNSMRVASLSGLLPVANDFVIDDEVGFAKVSGAFVFNQSVWEGYPLVAQQLLFDSTAVMLDQNISGSTQFQVDGLAEAVNTGGSVNSLDDDARDGIRRAHDDALSEIKSNSALADAAGLLAAIEDATTAWAETAEGLGFTGDISYKEFSAWHAENGYDLTEYIDQLYTEVFSEYRPS